MPGVGARGRVKSYRCRWASLDCNTNVKSHRFPGPDSKDSRPVDETGKRGKFLLGLFRRSSSPARRAPRGSKTMPTRCRSSRQLGRAEAQGGSVRNGGASADCSSTRFPTFPATAHAVRRPFPSLRASPSPLHRQRRTRRTCHPTRLRRSRRPLLGNRLRESNAEPARGSCCSRVV